MYCILNLTITRSLIFTYICLGTSGTMYSGLSVGSHTIDVRFTPTGSTSTLTLMLDFDIGKLHA